MGAVVGWLTGQEPDFSSDASGLQCLLGILGMVALAMALLMQLLKKWRPLELKVVAVSRIVCCYYVSLQLLKYGFDKVFKGQFYLPEPNILYTQVGQMDKSMLFWTAMGTSWSYNVFMGLMEVTPAVLLLFKKTRVLGLVLATGVLLQVFMINVGFEITVKWFSGFLLGLSLLLLSPYFQPIFVFLIRQGKTSLPGYVWQFPIKMPVFIYATLKTFVVGLLFLEGTYPYLKYNNFNDDQAPRPVLHGAYEVLRMDGTNGDTLAWPLPVKRIFIHRRGYLIVQDARDDMQDYKLVVAEGGGWLMLTDYEGRSTQLPFRSAPKDSLLMLQYPYQGEVYTLTARQLCWKELPLLREH